MKAKLKTQYNDQNLCGYCDRHFPECAATVGVGNFNNNIIECNGFDPFFSGNGYLEIIEIEQNENTK